MKLDPASGIRNPESIKNIIFDFGGVICDLDLKALEKSFRDLGMKNFDPAYSGTGGESLFSVFERGAIPPGQFRDGLRKFLPAGISDEAIDKAWNSVLQDIPMPRIRLLEELRTQYRIFLLSNSNEIHYQYYVSRLREQFGYKDFDSLFEKAWFSFRLKLQKPDPAIFRFVLAQHALTPGETLFIDDTAGHVESAQNIGIQGLVLNPGVDLTSFFT